MVVRRHAPALVFDFVINTLLTIIEYGAAMWSGSAALLADASQNLTDSLVISVSYLCEKAVGKPGLTKPQVLHIYRRAGATNALILMGLAVFIAVAAAYRTIHPQAVNSGLVIAIGLLSIAVNFTAAGILYRSHRDRNVAAPYTGLLFSGLSGIGVFCSGVITYVWHFTAIDGATGLVIASLLFGRSTRLFFASLTRPHRLHHKIAPRQF